jgi:fibronectin-binding autotransporter adhesin
MNRLMFGLMSCVALVPVIAPTPAVWAATLAWDTNTGTSGAQGGGGLWHGTSFPAGIPFWWNGTTNVTWTNGSTATFGPTAGTAIVDSATTASRLIFSTNGYTINGSSTLTLSSGNIEVTSASDTATINAPIGGSSGFGKSGDGTLVFSGSNANVYTGTTTVGAGTLHLNKSGGNAIPGDLTIGQGTGAASSAIVTQGADNQIPDTATVTIGSDGFWNLASGNRSETIAGLTMTTGSIATGSGTLTVGGNITTNANAASATISGLLNLGGAFSEITVADGSADVDLDISANISNGSVSKLGAGTVSTSGTNSAGILSVDGGALNQSGGSWSVFSLTTRASSSTYTLSAGTLTVNGNGSPNTFSEQIALSNSSTGTFTQTSGTHTITGALIIAAGPDSNATFNLSAGQLSTNSLYIGENFRAVGTLNQSGGAIAVTTGFLDLGLQDSTGTANLTDGTLSAQGIDVGGISTGPQGIGVLNINGGQVSTPGGVRVWDTTGSAINLSAGSLTADTINTSGNSSRFNFTGGTLHVKTFNGDLVNQGGTLAPGSSPGITTVNGNYIQEAAATLQIEIGGTASTQFDQLHISGALALDGTLNVSLISPFSPAAGDSYDILDWGSRTGTFATFVLPTLANGLVWNTSQLYTTGVLAVIVTDFNNDGQVDAADYVLWRKTPNAFGGDPAGYNAWRASFGESTAGTAAAIANQAVVPEPSTAALLIVAIVAFTRSCCLRPLPARRGLLLRRESELLLEVIIQ